jgi:hypothetical protein
MPDIVNMSLGEQVPPPHVGVINYHRNLTPELAIIRMQPGDGRAVPDFKAGQFVALGLKLDSHPNIGPTQYHRLLKKRGTSSFTLSPDQNM